MHTKIRWGIIGLGQIAHKFASDIQLSSSAILQGVASRDIDKARSFSKKFNAAAFCDSYEELAKATDIDVVYIATPNVFHFENTLLCLRHGKSVLCEKPLGMNREEVKIMMEVALSNNCFLMEGLWTRFIPAMEKVLALIKEGAIGDLKFIHADFGFKAPIKLEGRVYNKKLGGGSLLDIGIYPVFLSLLTLGIPTDIKAMSRMTQTAVDSYCAMLFDYESSAKAMLESTIEFNTPTEACIYGSKGTIKMHSRFHHSEKISWHQDGKLKEVFDMRYSGNGYFYEIEEVNKCLTNKAVESSKLPPSVSLSLITILDKIRDKIGLVY